MIIKKLYNFYRNCRSKVILGINQSIYHKRFCVDKSVYVRKGFVVTIEENGYVKIGKNSFFNNYCTINSLSGIEIGENCIFGENVHMYDHNHIYDDCDIPINEQGFTMDKIIIGNNCWVGSNVTILKGVKIGEHCIIGAGCIVYKDIPDNTVLVCKQQMQKIRKL